MWKTSRQQFEKEGRKVDPVTESPEGREQRM